MKISALLLMSGKAARTRGGPGKRSHCFANGATVMQEMDIFEIAL